MWPLIFCAVGVVGARHIRVRHLIIRIISKFCAWILIEWFSVRISHKSRHLVAVSGVALAKRCKCWDLAIIFSRSFFEVSLSGSLLRGLFPVVSFHQQTLLVKCWTIWSPQNEVH